ncbi:SprT-like family-domain-containing protein [Abortiporus biennis]|nr:SprT-like family-domain-containing protein [Abortiporus biennis]
MPEIRANLGIIEISSDEDEDTNQPPPVRLTGKTSRGPSRLKRLVVVSDSDSDSDAGNRDSEPEESQPVFSNQLSNSRKPASIAKDSEVIDLTISSSESEKEPTDDVALRFKRMDVSRTTTVCESSKTSTATSIAVTTRNSDSEKIETSGAEDNGAILILDEPRSARKPIRCKNPATPTATPKRTTKIIVDFNPRNSDNDSEVQTTPLSLTQPRQTQIETPKSKGNGRSRLTKKAIAAAEQSRREHYAQDFFNELNEQVFNNEIPKETALKWSNRLLTTAGKARWRRSREGVNTTEIELAMKILDDDERIRNTLAHEMCHIACWIIDKSPNEAHGHIFKSWARRVMHKRSDVEVTTRHSYEIKYKYQWECVNCAKTYGRFSKSIRPDECVCGACKVGQLKPLFTTRARRTPSKPKETPSGCRDVVEVLPSLLEGLSIDGVVTKGQADRDKVSTIELLDDGDSDHEDQVTALVEGIGNAKLDD